MKIEVAPIENGLLVTFTPSASMQDPMAMNGARGPLYCHNRMELMGRIAEWVNMYVPEPPSV